MRWTMRRSKQRLDAPAKYVVDVFCADFGAEFRNWREEVMVTKRLVLHVAKRRRVTIGNHEQRHSIQVSLRDPIHDRGGTGAERRDARSRFARNFCLCDGHHGRGSFAVGECKGHPNFRSSFNQIGVAAAARHSEQSAHPCLAQYPYNAFGNVDHEVLMQQRVSSYSVPPVFCSYTALLDGTRRIATCRQKGRQFVAKASVSEVIFVALLSCSSVADDFKVTVAGSPGSRSK